MTVLQAMCLNADKLSKCNSREEVYQILSKEVDASTEEYRKANDDMAFIYHILKAIFEDGKMDDAKKVYEAAKFVVEERMPKK